MKLTIEVEDKEEFISALNNAIITYNNLACTVLFGLQVPEQFEKMLMDKVGPDPDDQYALLKKRIDILKDVYRQIEEEKGD